jgi:hypothetical protein
MVNVIIYGFAIIGLVVTLLNIIYGVIHLKSLFSTMSDEEIDTLIRRVTITSTENIDWLRLRLKVISETRKKIELTNKQFTSFLYWIIRTKRHRMEFTKKLVSLGGKVKGELSPRKKENPWDSLDKVEKRREIDRIFYRWDYL